MSSVEDLVRERQEWEERHLSNELKRWSIREKQVNYWKMLTALIVSIVSIVISITVAIFSFFVP